MAMLNGRDKKSGDRLLRMRAMKRWNVFLCVFALACGCFSLPAYAQLKVSGKTTLTVVNLVRSQYGNIVTPVDVASWPSWPYTGPSGKEHLNLKSPEDYVGQTVRMDNANIEPHIITWTTIPVPTPWAVLAAPDLNSMICNVLSEDNGKNFVLISWDYIRNSDQYKHLETPFSNNYRWIGTIVHSFCGFDTSGACNGTYRTNMMFSAYP
jgi:hypothetical protein